MIEDYWETRGPCGVFTRAALRTLQFVFAVIVSALYGVDLAHSTTSHRHADASWIYAEVVACLSAVTCAIHCFVTVKRVAWTTWDWVLSVLWAAQFGVFASIYTAPSGTQSEQYEGMTKSVERMKAAVWIDLINMALWLITAVMGIAWCCRARRFSRRTDVELELKKSATNESDATLAVEPAYKDEAIHKKDATDEKEDIDDKEAIYRKERLSYAPEK